MWKASKSTSTLGPEPASPEKLGGLHREGDADKRQKGAEQERTGQRFRLGHRRLLDAAEPPGECQETRDIASGSGGRGRGLGNRRGCALKPTRSEVKRGLAHLALSKGSGGNAGRTGRRARCHPRPEPRSGAGEGEPAQG